MKWTFVLKDKGTSNQGWWLKISTLEELAEYYELNNPERYGEVIEDYMNNANDHYSSLTNAIIRYSANNHYTILQGIQGFELMIAEQQMESLREDGAIYINRFGGYHGAYNGEPKYDEIETNELNFPRDDYTIDRVESIIKDNNEGSFRNEFGWLSPTGDFYESKWGTHEDKAREICIAKGIRNKNNSLVSSRDTLSKLGWCLIHNPSERIKKTAYIVSHERELTKKQKDFLYGYFIDMGMNIQAEEYIK